MAFAALVTVAAVGLGTAVAAGTGKAIAGGVQKKKAKEAKLAEQARLEEYKQEYAGLDTSNPYANMEAVYGDLTVNQQQAQFEKEQQMQSQSNILDQMRGAAGGSGIAALAQTLASQSQLQAQQASASIGQQERANQQLQLQEEAAIRDKKIEGEIASRQAEGSKLQTLMGMKAGEVTAAATQENLAAEAMYGGIGDVAEAGMAAAQGAATGAAGVA